MLFKASAKNEDFPELQRDLLAQYVHNHSTSKYATPAICIIISYLISQWLNPVHVGIWLFLLLSTSLVSAIVSKKFGDGSHIDPSKLKYWYMAVAIPRLLFILTWASIVLWGWDPALRDSFYFASALVIITTAMNASQSGPVMPFFFMEMLPKVIFLAAVTLFSGDTYMQAMGIGGIISSLFFTKIAFSINKSTRAILTQKYSLAKAKEDVERASRAKSAFLATMSHEVRTPLNGILGIVGLMKDTGLNAEQSEYAETIRYSGETLLTMLNDILDFSKMEAGKLDIETVSFDTTRLVHGVVSLMRSRAAEKNISLVYHIEEGVPAYISSDPTRLRQVLLNLIGNAIKFTEKGSVKLSVCKVNADGVEGGEQINDSVQLRFEVQDSGIGISEESQKLLFQNFSQVDSTITRRYGGTGLGLSICKNIVELMKGTIGVQSVAGIGSKFWFEIPVMIAAGDSTIVDVDDSMFNIPKLAPLSILLAEDNSVNQKVAVGIISKYGHSVDVVVNGREAVEAVKRKSYDLVLMDMQMPEMDGLQATQKIISLGEPYSNIPIIALTANAMRGDDIRCLEAGMVDHVSKPIRPHTLFRTIADHLPHKLLEEGPDSKSNVQILDHARPPKREASIDLANIRELERTLGPAFVRGFMSDYINELDVLLNRLGGALSAKDYKVTQESAHDLKSLSATFGMRDVMHLAEAIEMCCLHEQGDEALPLYDKLKGRMDSDVVALRAAYDGPSAKAGNL